LAIALPNRVNNAKLVSWRPPAWTGLAPSAWARRSGLLPDQYDSVPTKLRRYSWFAWFSPKWCSRLLRSSVIRTFSGQCCWGYLWPSDT